MLDKKFWEKYFLVYDVLNELIPYQELAQSIISNLEVKEGDRVLDLGSGTGNVAIKAEKEGAVVTAIDFSKEGTELHKKKSPAAQVIVGDITNRLPFDDESFDKVYSNNVIYTIPEEKRTYMFSELYRVTRLGGLIVIVNPMKGFSPKKIYFDHIRKEVKEKGILFAILKIIKLVIPTIKMFYYNALITRENTSGEYEFMNENDQKQYLEDAGFKDVSENLYVYSGQAVLSVASK